ncbi:endolytic transglycosylase MltG [Cryobacterium roopkundense]|uniref:Endolytic murein transglycosylase n=1 Tax=Cryobacterium roopkundense TaxID=1001240 RepID=A0A7W8ZWC2_9MICO|nr:endolytic transglycosylase MltG [Cryobacterium roopkundense]MBB5641381.1 UPF0755 protein [Cryobacterium roopkundense]
MPSRRSLRAAQQAQEEAEQIALSGEAPQSPSAQSEPQSESQPAAQPDASAVEPIREPEADSASDANLFAPSHSESDEAHTGDRAHQRAAGRTRRRAELAAEPQREKRKSRKGTWGCLIALLVIVALLAAGAFALQGPITQLINAVQGPADYAGAGEEDVIVMIHDGDTGSDVAQTLVSQDVVQSFDAFYATLLTESPEPVFQPGAYQLKTQMSSRSALDALLDSANKLEQTVQIPEGTAAADILQLMTEGTDIPLADLQAAAADIGSFGLPAEATNLEGFLFPATYTFVPGISADDALQTLVDRQFQALDAAGVAVENRWSTIVLASLIQREAGLRDDYYKVSRVFLNRNDPAQWSSGLMQSDATVAYGTGNTHLVTTTDAERADASNLYNTYVHPGLPVGPISNPGDLAIDAAIHPADGPWLFFVTVNLDSGETVFSTTLAEHEAAVVTWQDWMRANRG